MGDLGLLFDLTLMFASILFVASMSGYMSEKAGVVNIGIDGMMCMGALFFGIFSSNLIGLDSLSVGGLLIALVLTMICTMSMGALHAFACINLKANHIISGTAINLLGLALATFLNSPLANSLFEGAVNLRTNFQPFLSIGGGLFGSSIIIFGLILVLCGGIWLVMSKTKVGLRYQAVGENPNAVDAQGINVIKYQWVAVLLSSALAGLAGGLFLFNIGTFAGNVQSMGYLGLAILIAGAWRIPWMFVFSLVFAIFTACVNTTTLTQLNVPQEFTYAIPYIVTLLILVVSSKKVMPPAHSGIPFEKSKR